MGGPSRKLGVDQLGTSRKESFAVIDPAQVIAAFAALCAAIAAYGSNRAARINRMMGAANLVRAFLEEYGTEDMKNHLRNLVRWEREHGIDFATAWIQKYKDQDPEAHALDISRRHVKGYFERAARLFDAGLLDRKTLKAVAAVDGLNVYFRVVCPLEMALNRHADRAAERTLRKRVKPNEDSAPEI